jgi:hypothetical protein
MLAHFSIKSCLDKPLFLIVRHAALDKEIEMNAS